MPLRRPARRRRAASSCSGSRAAECCIDDQHDEAIAGLDRRRSSCCAAADRDLEMVDALLGIDCLALHRRRRVRRRLLGGRGVRARSTVPRRPRSAPAYCWRRRGRCCWPRGCASRRPGSSGRSRMAEEVGEHAVIARALGNPRSSQMLLGDPEAGRTGRGWRWSTRSATTRRRWPRGCYQTVAVLRAGCRPALRRRARRTSMRRSHTPPSTTSRRPPVLHRVDRDPQERDGRCGTTRSPRPRTCSTSATPVVPAGSSRWRRSRSSVRGAVTAAMSGSCSMRCATGSRSPRRSTTRRAVAVARGEAHLLEGDDDAVGRAACSPGSRRQCDRRTPDWIGRLGLLAWRAGHLDRAAGRHARARSALPDRASTAGCRHAGPTRARRTSPPGPCSTATTRSTCVRRAPASSGSAPPCWWRAATTGCARIGPGAARGARASTRANPGGLTDRELEVLELLDEGLRNAEIAARLQLSEKTVGHHVSAILAKLGVARGSRRCAARATSPRSGDLRRRRRDQGGRAAQHGECRRCGRAGRRG